MKKTQNPKIVLITGCSSGFGMITAARLAAKGHQVVATMRNLNKKEALLSEVRRRGGTVNILPLDVTKKKTIRDCMKEVASQYGNIDILVNNAGFGIIGFFEDLTDDEIREQMETNLFGVLNVTREAIPLMRNSSGAKIINISSMSGCTAYPAFSAYNMSKWALESFSESLRYELEFFGIDVLLIEPGMYRTKIFFENGRIAKNYDNPQSPYYDISKFFEERIRSQADDCHKDPEEISIIIDKLIEKRKPRFRNIPDLESQIHLAVRRILPYRWYSAFMRWLIFHNYRPSR